MKNPHRFALLALLPAFILAGCNLSNNNINTTPEQKQPVNVGNSNTNRQPANETNANDSRPPAVNSNRPTVNDNVNIAPQTQIFNLNARNFAFSQTELRVKQGDRITINLTSTDGFHDWTIDEFNASTQRVSTGETASVTFVADKKGSFEYYCSVGNHRALGMVGRLIVE